MIEDVKHFPFYCIECFADSSQDCICKKILRYDKETDIPVVELTDAECQYLSKSGTNKKESVV
jgi:hypothetical protein